MDKFNIDRSTINFFYKKYKDYIIPIFTIVVSFILLLEVTFPTLNNLTEREQEVKFEKTKLATLKNNLQILTGLNENILDSQLVIVSNALPTGKNFAEILNAVSISANKSGVFLGDYEFQVGDLTKTTTPPKGLPSLSLSLVLNGNAQSTTRFANELYKSFPISEITNIEVNGNRAILSVVFYYKPVSSAKPDENLPLANLSQGDLDIILDMSSWNNPRGIEEILPVISPSPTASPSAL